MNSLIHKVAGLLPTLEARGTIYLFALAEQGDWPRWDVVISSAWSDQDEIAAVRYVADLLTSLLTPAEITMVSRVAIIPSNGPGMQETLAEFGDVVPEDRKVIYVSLLGSDIRRGYVFKASQPPPVPPAEALVEALVHA